MRLARVNRFQVSGSAHRIDSGRGRRERNTAASGEGISFSDTSPSRATGDRNLSRPCADEMHVNRPPVSLDALAKRWRVPVFSRTGHRIGRLDDAFSEARGGPVRWVAITYGLLRRRFVVVPPSRVQLGRDAIVVDETKAHVRSSPAVHGSTIDLETDRRLREHYRCEDVDLGVPSG